MVAMVISARYRLRAGHGGGGDLELDLELSHCLKALGGAMTVPTVP